MTDYQIMLVDKFGAEVASDVMYVLLLAECLPLAPRLSILVEDLQSLASEALALAKELQDV